MKTVFRSTPEASQFRLLDSDEELQEERGIAWVKNCLP